MPEQRPSFPQMEEEVLAQWEQQQIFKQTIEKDAPRGSFVFFEGPPTANGRPGIHHAEARAFKDCIPRFRTMQGYRVVRKAGWDTHGLPVELEVEKQLGFTGKAQIEEFGIAAFNEKCKQSVWTYKQEWERFTKRLGFWVDMNDAYVTYDPKYVESLWRVVKQVWDRGLLYQDYRVTPHCPRCETSLSSHELSQGYKDVQDLAVTVKFHLKPGQGYGAGKQTKDTAYLLAWTTTPWTLPGNVALAVGADLPYVAVRVKDVEGMYILTKDRLSAVFAGKEIEMVHDDIKGSDLVGLAYEPLYPFMGTLAMPETQQKLESTAYRVHAADFVTTAEGTGIVHTAVMYGADDFELGQKIGLPKQHLVKLNGTFVDGTDFLAGRLVVDEQVAVDIIKDLAHRGLLFDKAKYTHSYPFCWRCKTKVIYYAKDSWYIRMSELREELLKQNASIHWEPEHIRDGRFGEWLREVKDWAFSRERYWGTPLPIWKSEDSDVLCIGSFEELRAFAKDKALVDEAFDPHRPFVDDVVLIKDGKEYRRVADVCDVWFDSGAMPFAQWHYPFENKELVDSGKVFPADYISEAVDQTRGWFYTLLAVSVLLGRGTPYKNVICLGHVLDAAGKKMSKSTGNIVEPMVMIEKYGADAVRWYMYTVNQPGDSKRFDEKALDEMSKKVFGLTWNVLSFYELYATDAPAPDLQPTSKLDCWILARLQQLIERMTADLEAYRVTEPVRDLAEFLNELSTWWLRRSRERFKSDDAADKQQALSVLRTCLQQAALLMAPFAPFFSESVYQRVDKHLASVHLESWPVGNAPWKDEALLASMGRVRSVVSLALEQRAKSGLPVRQVLARATVSLPEGEMDRELQELVADEINVKEVVVQNGEYAVELDLTITPELRREGAVRELIRRVNALRKESGLTIADRIELFVKTAEPELQQAVHEHESALLAGTLASGLRTSGEAPTHVDRFRVSEWDVIVGF